MVTPSTAGVIARSLPATTSNSFHNVSFHSVASTDEGLESQDEMTTEERCDFLRQALSSPKACPHG